jgi:hypothetical protein
MARSPNAFIDIPFKFSTSVSFDTIQLFDKAIREFVKARPREWSKFSGFRVTKVVTELGYVGKLTLRPGLEELSASILHTFLCDRTEYSVYLTHVSCTPPVLLESPYLTLLTSSIVVSQTARGLAEHKGDHGEQSDSCLILFGGFQETRHSLPVPSLACRSSPYQPQRE